jgi:glycerophosphoryl diester phosphodiesterase
VNLRREGAVLTIGHRGAPALAPENTLESLAAAIDHGVDLVEIDVTSVQETGSLALAHSLGQLTPASPGLDAALAFVAASEAGVIVDLKSAGIETAVVEALRAHDLLDRSVVASFQPRSLRVFKEVEPRLATGLSYPFDRAGIADRPAFQPLIRAGLAGLRRTLPARIGRLLARARADAALLHHALVSRRLVERCHGAGAAVLAWTVEDEDVLARMLAAGVDGVIANDPRLFSTSPPRV